MNPVGTRVNPSQVRASRPAYTARVRPLTRSSPPTARVYVSVVRSNPRLNRPKNPPSPRLTAALNAPPTTAPIPAPASAPRPQATPDRYGCTSAGNRSSSQALNPCDRPRNRNPSVAPTRTNTGHG